MFVGPVPAPAQAFLQMVHDAPKIGVLITIISTLFAALQKRLTRWS